MARQSRRSGSRRGRRSTGSSRRRAATGRTSTGGGLVLAGLVVAVALIEYLSDHPAVFVGVLVVAALLAGAALWGYQARLAAVRRREAELTRHIAVADGLTGPQFEHWVAALLRRTGFTAVAVCGGSGDLGADVTAASPSGRRVVVQCKRLRADRAVGSPDVQRFAGTARALHHADIAVIITTGRFSAPAVTTAARLNIALVDRQALAAWAASGAGPAPLNGHH